MKTIRNSYVASMKARHKSSRPMNDRREKRAATPKRSWKEDVR